MSTMDDVKDYLSGKQIRGTVQLSSKVSVSLLDRLKREKKRASALKKDSTASTAEIDECKRLIANIQNLLSPIRRFPPEILSEIFVQYIHGRKSWPEFRTRSTIKRKKQQFYDDLPPVVFLSQVCIFWRETIFAMPSLWSNLSFSIHKRLPPAQALAGWLNRSRTLPLNIIIRDFRRHPYGDFSFLADNLIPFCSRWCSLELSIGFSYLTPLLQAGPLSLPLLERVSLLPNYLLSHARLPALESAPRLRYFDVTSVAGYNSNKQLNITLPCSRITHLALNGIPQGPSEIFPFIQGMTSLQSLTSQLSDFPRDWESMQTFEFPSLRMLHIEFLGNLGSPQFLDALKLPALRELSIKHPYDLEAIRRQFVPDDDDFFDTETMYPFDTLFSRTDPSNPLLNLYTRSGFELTHLALDGIASIRTSGLLKFLKLTPMLECLELDRCHLNIETLCEALEVKSTQSDDGGPALLVPNMTKFRLVQDRQYEKMLEELADAACCCHIGSDYSKYEYTVSRMIKSRWNPSTFYRFYYGREKCRQDNPQEWLDSWPVKRLTGGLEVSEDVLNPELRDAEYLPRICGENELDRLKEFEEQGMPVKLL
ncbi:hypothetical protein VKT23_009239 [Stygiomarasmius scandens]|uniref:F-box domain-containing protein n=1 Tax=Marasmiellus scandens TaxID=2682957 RepID=A0ABR1JHE3_9AGAR